MARAKTELKPAAGKRVVPLQSRGMLAQLGSAIIDLAKVATGFEPSCWQHYSYY